MSAIGGKADIPASTTRRVSLQFSQRGFLPRRSYDSMPRKRVAPLGIFSDQRGGGGIPPIGPSMGEGPQSGGSFPINVVKKVGLDEKWDREDENLARS